jgi:hypothetical protein
MIAESEVVVCEVSAVEPSGLRVIATMAESKRVVCEVSAMVPKELRGAAMIAESEVVVCEVSAMVPKVVPKDLCVAVAIAESKGMVCVGFSVWVGWWLCVGGDRGVVLCACFSHSKYSGVSCHSSSE